MGLTATASLGGSLIDCVSYMYGTPHVHGHAAYYVLVCNHALPVHIQPRCLSSMIELIKYTSKLNFHEKKPHIMEQLVHFQYQKEETQEWPWLYCL